MTFSLQYTNTQYGINYSVTNFGILSNWGPVDAHIGDGENKISLRSRHRKTSSPYDWVRNIKTFKLYTIEYTIYFNKIGSK